MYALVPVTAHACMQPVAVKVRHPGVEQRLRADFAVMLALARAAATLPVLRDLRFDDSCAQFGLPLKQQLDLLLEARNLDRFRRNFRCAPGPARRGSHARIHAWPGSRDDRNGPKELPRARPTLIVVDTGSLGGSRLRWPAAESAGAQPALPLGRDT